METVLFRQVKVIDGSGAAPFTGDVLVCGSRIADVGERLEAPEGARVVDVPGSTIMPGLIE